MQALWQLEAAHEAVDEGRYEDALAAYSYVVDNFPDLALAEYARLGRALMLYQTGTKPQRVPSILCSLPRCHLLPPS